MKKIGIIDYFIDEWHSNVYTELFEKANAAHLIPHNELKEKLRNAVQRQEPP